LENKTFSSIIVLVPIDRSSLPHDPAILQQMLVDLTAQLDKTNRLLRQLLEAKHSTRSESLSPDQLHLFLKQMNAEGEKTESGSSANDTDKEPPAAGSGASQGEGQSRGRRPLAPHLKRERIEHDLSEAEKHCDDCAEDLHCIGEETSERYEYIPAKFVVIEDVCKKYACQCTVKTATKPPQPIARSTAGASLLAQVIVGKIADHLPVHRQAKMYARLGVEIPDQTMCGWLRQSAEMLNPLYESLKGFVLSSKVTGTDDTPVRVLDRSIKGTTRKGRLWPYTGDRDHPGVIYDYTPTRERAGPERFLKEYRGHLQADAYSVYDSFFTDPERGLVEVACWAHYPDTAVIQGRRGATL
jgi:transposase